MLAACKKKAKLISFCSRSSPVLLPSRHGLLGRGLVGCEWELLGSYLGASGEELAGEFMGPFCWNFYKSGMWNVFWVMMTIGGYYDENAFHIPLFEKSQSWNAFCLCIFEYWGLSCHIAALDLVVNTQVVVVALGGDESLVDGVFYGAVGLVAVCAVGKVTVVESLAHFGEEVRELFGFNVHHAKLFDARTVDEEGCLGVVKLHEKHFGKGGGVLAFHAPFADFADAEVEAGCQGVEHGRFAHSGMAREEHGLSGDELSEFGNAVAFERADGIDRVAGGLIHFLDFVVDFPESFFVKVDFVEDDACGNMVGFGSDEESIDKSGGSAWKSECCDDAKPVDIGCDDVGLFGEFSGFADNVVLAVTHLGDDAGAIVLE